MLRMSLLATLVLSLCQDAAHAQMSHHQHASEAACEEPTLRCATKVTPAFGPDGTLWLVWMAGGQVSVASSPDAGRIFSAPTQVTTKRLNLDWGPDARPKIVVDRKGGIALAFSIFRDEAFNGQVLYTRSADGGKSFAELKPITANNESQRFEALALDQDGTVFAAWLDKRNRIFAKEAGQKYEGAGLFFTSSGRVYKLKVYRLPLGTPQSRGRPMVNLLPNLVAGERISTVMPLPEEEEESWADLTVMFATATPRFAAACLQY